MRVIKRQEEIVFLLEFFSQPAYPAWLSVPDLAGPRRVNIGMMDFDTDQPIRILSAILASLLNGNNLQVDVDTAEVLEEIRVLLTWYMIESVRDEIFEKRLDSCEFDLIWRILARLCQTALADPNLKRINHSQVSLVWLLAQYTVD